MTAQTQIIPSLDDPGKTRADFVSGLLVFLIAMPLCLAISKASNFPPIAGIWTAVIGGLFATFISNSPLTIKGPAAGLIVIVAGCVTEMGEAFGATLPEGEKLMLGYRLTLGVGVVSGVVQILFGLLRVGRLGDFFPLAAVHGMLAAIGIIIFAKQMPIVLGADVPKGLDPIQMLGEIPNFFAHLNPAISVIGVMGLVVLFGLPLINNRWVRRIPGPMVVLLIAVPLGMAMDLEHQHTYLFPDSFFDAFGANGQQHLSPHEVGPRFLVDMPEVVKNPESAFFLPNFSGVFSGVGLKFLVLFAMIGSLESLLSAKAIDLLDPWQRKTNLDRDLMGIGVANTLVALIGGLPMISEIVRSSANINNGARTRMANLWHAVFLLGFVLFLPNLIHRIPLAALAAMLVYTGFRLASPREFVKTFKVGKEQLVVFVTTIVVTLATDLLVGVASGIAMEFVLHLLHGMPVTAAFRPTIETEEIDDRTVRVRILRAAVFTNWLRLKKILLDAKPDGDVVLDFSQVKYVDHTVMEKLHELERDFIKQNRRLTLDALEELDRLSWHPQAARKRRRNGSTNGTSLDSSSKSVAIAE